MEDHYSMEDYLDTEDLYFSKFARLLVAKFPLIRRIHIIFERAEVGKSFSSEMYIPTHPKNKIYIEPDYVYVVLILKQFHAGLIFGSIFHCNIRIWTSSLSWSGINNESRNVFTIDVCQVDGRNCLTCKILETFDAQIIQVYTRLSRCYLD